HRALLEMQIHAHGAVVMHDAHEVAGRIGATAGLAVLGAYDHPAPRGDNRRAHRHGNVHGVTPLRAGVTVASTRPLGHAERAAPPGQWITLGQMPGTWITQRVTQPVFV